MRTPLIAANWKMNPAPIEDQNSTSLFTSTIVDTVVFPTALDIHTTVQAGLATGGQHGRAEVTGAYTGEVSMQQLKAAGCTYVLCGHSERRKYHNETDAEVATQVTAAVAIELIPVVCIGETLQQREGNQMESVLRTQLASLPNNTQIIIAYEPVWAIGTGVSASPEQAEAAHVFIRSILPADTAETTRILYGGSVKSSNAQSLLEQPNIDGALIGGASLIPEEFATIVQIAEGLTK